LPQIQTPKIIETPSKTTIPSTNFPSFGCSEELDLLGDVAEVVAVSVDELEDEIDGSVMFE